MAEDKATAAEDKATAAEDKASVAEDKASVAEDKAPFHSFAFSLTERSGGRSLVTMQATDAQAATYELHVEKGPAQSPDVSFTRTVPRKTAEGLRDAMAEAGVFGWDETYGDLSNPGAQRWTLKIVFQEGVFTQECSGGSDVPDGFSSLLEALYRLDLPRPGVDDAPLAANTFSGSRMPGVPDLSALFAGAPEGGPDAAMLEEMQRTLADMQANPERFQQQLKDEFKYLPREQQDQMLDMLASTGMASRDWWEKFLRG